MTTLIKNVRIIDPMSDIDLIDDIAIGRDEITISPRGDGFSVVIDGTNKVVAPGLIDLHVHFREPGFLHKESIATGIQAALRGGVTSALVMPNTEPAIDEPKHIALQKARAKKSGFDLMVAACASKGLRGEHVVDIGALRAAGASAVTDDGKPILGSQMMENVLRACRRHDLVCMQHAEDTQLSHYAAMHEGKVSTKLGVTGQPCEAEYKLVERDIKLAHRIGARYHVLHISCKESLALVERAQRQGARVSCEVTPHHLLLCDEDVMSKDTFKKMNPPLRPRDDAQALLHGLHKGHIAAVASDHAPHATKEKRAPFDCAPFGVVGVESSILVLLTLVKKGKLSLRRAIETMTIGPAQILQEEHRIGGLLGERRYKNAVLLDPNCSRIFSKRDVAGLSSNSAFFGREIFGRLLATFLHGELVYRSHA